MSARNTPINDDELLALSKVHTHSSGKPNAEEIGRAMGRSPSTIKSALKRLEIGITPGEVFEVPEGHSVKGISALVDANGVTVQQWIKTANSAAGVAKEAILEAFESYRGVAELIPPPVDCDSSLLTLYGIADLHLGMQAWGRETGQSWDLKIARATILSAIGELISCAPKSETAVILDLGDFTHNNDQSNATPASGHQLDVDGRFPKIAREAVKISIEMAELALQKHEKVILRFLPGNHDPEAAQWIAIALSLFFEKNPRVTVDGDPSDFWFHRHGKVMLAANHGHKMKPEELPGVMASYRPDDWGNTRYRYGFSGHIHHIRAGEKHGAKWETLRTVAARDAYAHQHGYMSGRELVSITFHEDKGERMRQTVSV